MNSLFKLAVGGVRKNGLVMAMAVLAAPVSAATQSSWKPERSVEIVVTSAPGSGGDVTGRFVQRILQERRLVETPVTVANKPGGGGAIAYHYLNQHKGNGHFIVIAGKNLLTGHILGRVPYTYSDVTPLAILFEEYICVAVRADSAIRSGRDLIERMKKDPTSLSFGIASALGNPNQQSVAMPLKEAGVELRKIRNVVFNSGGIAMTALLGGHVDVVPGSVGLMLRHLQTGEVRVIAVAAPRRFAGALASAPTWNEQGANTVVSNWRGVVGPGGMSREQIAYWDDALRALVRADEWKKELERNNWNDEYKASVEAGKAMQADYVESKRFLTDLELVK